MTLASMAIILTVGIKKDLSVEDIGGPSYGDAKEG
jgi:hypothetical protein